MKVPLVPPQIPLGWLHVTGHRRQLPHGNKNPFNFHKLCSEETKTQQVKTVTCLLTRGTAAMICSFNFSFLIFWLNTLKFHPNQVRSC